MAAFILAPTSPIVPLDDLDKASPLPALPLDDLLPIGGIPSLIGALVVGVITMDGDGVVLTGGSVVDGTVVGASVKIVSTGDGVGGLIMDRGGVGESDVDPSVGGNVIGALVIGNGNWRNRWFSRWTWCWFLSRTGRWLIYFGFNRGSRCVRLSITLATVGLIDGEGDGSTVDSSWFLGTWFVRGR